MISSVIIVLATFQCRRSVWSELFEASLDIETVRGTISTVNMTEETFKLGDFLIANIRPNFEHRKMRPLRPLPL
jgi:hypothetical protein